MSSLAVPLDQVRFISVDLETTGLDPQHDDIIEIGAVEVRDGHLADEFETLVYIDHTVPFTARRVHGIANDMLVGKPRIGEALPVFLEFVGEGTLVEHSWKAFDVAFLERAHGRPLRAPYINTCTLSRRLFPHMRHHNLEECCRRYGIDNPRKHRALSDARATAQVLVHLLQYCTYRYPLLQDLVAAASVER